MLSDTIKQHWGKYAEETTVHAIPQIYDAKVLWERICWIVFLSAAAAMCTYQVYNAVEYYKSEPVSIRINRLSTSRYKLMHPFISPIYYCPSDWLNVTKALKELQIPLDLLVYMLAVIEVTANKYGKGGSRRLSKEPEVEGVQKMVYGLRKNYFDQNGGKMDINGFKVAWNIAMGSEGVYAVIPDSFLIYAALFFLNSFDTTDITQDQYNTMIFDSLPQFLHKDHRIHQRSLQYLTDNGYQDMQELLVNISQDHFPIIVDDESSLSTSSIIVNKSWAIRQGRVCQVLHFDSTLPSDVRKPLLQFTADHSYSFEVDGYLENYTASANSFKSFENGFKSGIDIFLSFYEGFQWDMAMSDDYRHLTRYQIANHQGGFTKAMIDLDVVKIFEIYSHKYVNRKVDPCNTNLTERKPLDMYIYHCESVCFAKYISDLRNCSILVSRDSNVSGRRFCEFTQMFMDIAYNLSSVNDPSWQKVSEHCAAECDGKISSKACFDWKLLYSSHVISNDPTGKHMIQYNIDIKSLLLTEIYPLIDLQKLLSNFGGIIGSGIGASVVTLAEILVVLTKFLLQLYNSLKKRQPERKINSESIVVNYNNVKDHSLLASKPKKYVINKLDLVKRQFVNGNQRLSKSEMVLHKNHSKSFSLPSVIDKDDEIDRKISINGWIDNN